MDTQKPHLLLQVSGIVSFSVGTEASLPEQGPLELFGGGKPAILLLLVPSAAGKVEDKEESWGKCVLPPTQSLYLNSGSKAMGLAAVFTVRGHGVSSGVHGHCGMPMTY